MLMLLWLLAAHGRATLDNPPIQPIRTGFRHVEVGNLASQRIGLPVRDATGRRVLYRLVCGSGLDDDNPEDFSGLLMCRLLSSDRFQNPRDLLALERRGPGPSWDTRGRFLAAEVTGRCGNTPGWGRDRVFAVRGMLLRLKVADIERDRNGFISRYSFTASIQNRSKGARIPPLGAQPPWFGSVEPCG
jgi:hypothetical protein